ncbi:MULTISPECIES: polysaccharide biosynthesis C-terminal domain-containing protein [unclassified Dehalobacter]|uniref:polysaccharide biosynthesis C-terminal domain-containing protein n=1 Tax=unclassified Dehalobacter TaxID=2635733 RepID=UPI00037421F2|nr:MULTISPECIES: polysaccharide biosynthesis C-terminal domain-containing protein [unclassified Dehalobacter]RJE48973.1 hypothetical protein A7K50_07605 [Dehalobacter sp. MCB1]TCX51710.1 hypothetical protein C1I36_05105 [Dehalobacter sp. 14DCB1]TCX52770.1 hypothetical protein C1I38_06785 [Dehalobacter sp. 12DCB1]
MIFEKTIRKLTDNAYVFSMLARIIGVMTGLVHSILYTRYLGAELRGEASVILNYAGLISLVLCFGVYQAYPFFKKKTGQDIYREYINYVFGLFFLYIIISAILIFLLDLPTDLKVVTLLIPLLMGIKQLNYVVLIENPKLRNTASIRLDLFDIAFLVILMIFTTANYFLCITFLIVKHLVYFIIAVSNLKIKVKTIRPNLKGISPYIKYGIVPMVTVIFMEINYKVDVLILQYFNIDMAQIGIYSLGVLLANKLWMIPDALKDILLSKLTKGRTAEEVVKISRISFFMMLLFILAAVFFGKPVICLLYGAEFSGAYFVTMILLAGVLGMVFYKMVYSYNVVNGHKNVNLVLLGIAAILNVSLNIILIPSYGIMGAAAASFASYIVCGISFLVYFCLKTRTPLLDMLIIKRKDIKMIFNFIKK